MLAAQNLEVSYFVDNFKAGQSVRVGDKLIETRRPDALLAEERGTFAVLVGITTEPALTQVTAQLLGMGFAAGTDYYVMTRENLRKLLTVKLSFAELLTAREWSDDLGNVITVGEGCNISGTVSVCGCGNQIHIGNNVSIDNLSVTVSANNSELRIGDYVRRAGGGESITTVTINGIYGYTTLAPKVRFGENVSFNYNLLLFTNGSDIIIGKDCMLSSDIAIKTIVGHSMYDLHSGAQLVKPKPIHIQDHVWVGMNAVLLGNAAVGTGSVVGSYAVVAKKYPNNCAIAGNPARIVRRDIAWRGEH
ncbi:MAG: acyltransferase, partial [Oscillospiraceae bacterium]|nr:acyltransferase [Oscillospiraceae bacterium]